MRGHTSLSPMARRMRRARMGAYGHKRVREELSWEYEAPKLLAAYAARAGIPAEIAPIGTYQLPTGTAIDTDVHFRVGHPLAEAIIDTYLHFPATSA